LTCNCSCLSKIFRRRKTCSTYTSAAPSSAAAGVGAGSGLAILRRLPSDLVRVDGVDQSRIKSGRDSAQRKASPQSEGMVEVGCGRVEALSSCTPVAKAAWRDLSRRTAGTTALANYLKNAQMSLSSKMWFRYLRAVSHLRPREPFTTVRFLGMVQTDAHCICTTLRAPFIFA